MENLDLPRTMQAAHFRGNGQIDLVPKPVPIPEPGHLLLRVKANGYQTLPIAVEQVANLCQFPVTPQQDLIVLVKGEWRACRAGRSVRACFRKRGASLTSATSGPPVWRRRRNRNHVDNAGSAYTITAPRCVITWNAHDARNSSSVAHRSSL